MTTLGVDSFAAQPVRVGRDAGALLCRADKSGEFICKPTAPCDVDGEPCTDDTSCCGLCEADPQCERKRGKGDPPCPRSCEARPIAQLKAAKCPGKTKHWDQICWKRHGKKHNCKGRLRCSWGTKWHTNEGWRSVGVCKWPPNKPIFNCAPPAATDLLALPRSGSTFSRKPRCELRSRVRARCRCRAFRRASIRITLPTCLQAEEPKRQLCRSSAACVQCLHRRNYSGGENRCACGCSTPHVSVACRGLLFQISYLRSAAW